MSSNNQAPLTGTYRVTIDADGRIELPELWRGALPAAAPDGEVTLRGLFDRIEISVHPQEED